MTRLAQLSLVSKTRGLIVWTFWSGETDYVASSIDAYGNTKRYVYQTLAELRDGYKALRERYGYSRVAAW